MKLFIQEKSIMNSIEVETLSSYGVNQENTLQQCAGNEGRQEFPRDTADYKHSLDDGKSERDLSDGESNSMGNDKKAFCKSPENLSNVKYANGSAIFTPMKETLQISYNPFEGHPDSLQFLSCSPSVFATFQTKDKKTKTFRWSIDQIATLKPADIDETSQQDTGIEFDPEMEERAQKAIETFFSKNNVVPSPWGTLAKHVTFSPNLASTTFYASGDEPLNVSQTSTCQNAVKKTVWTQTQITVPPHVDLMEILGPVFTFVGGSCQVEEITEISADTDSISNSSLRRKLFPYENEHTPTNAIQKPVFAMKLWSSPITPQASAPPETNEDICTPGSVKTQYSSSPITPRNCSGVGVHISSPSVSPIGKSIFATPSTGSRSEGLDVLPESSSSTSKEQTGKELLPSSPMNVCVVYDNKKSHVVNDSGMQIGMQDEGEKDAFLCSVADMSCDEPANNHGNYSEVLATDQNVNKSKLSGSNFLKEPFSKLICQELELQNQGKDNDQLDSNLNSLAQDTGYQTASLYSFTHSSQGGMHSGFGTADSVMMPNSVQYENAIFQNEIEGSDFVHGRVQEKDIFRKHQGGYIQAVSFQGQHSTIAFNSLSWQPNKCSTPTKVPSAEIKHL